MFIGKLIREPGDPRVVHLRLSTELLSRTQIEPWAEVVVRVEGTRLVIEAVQEDTDRMEMFAEEFVAGYRGALRALGDGSCPRTG